MPFDEQKYLNLMKSNLSVFSFIVIAYCELRLLPNPEVMKVISFISSKSFCFCSFIFRFVMHLKLFLVGFIFFFFLAFGYSIVFIPFVEKNFFSSLDCFGGTHGWLHKWDLCNGCGSILL